MFDLFGVSGDKQNCMPFHKYTIGKKMKNLVLFAFLFSPEQIKCEQIVYSSSGLHRLRIRISATWWTFFENSTKMSFFALCIFSLNFSFEFHSIARKNISWNDGSSFECPSKLHKRRSLLLVFCSWNEELLNSMDPSIYYIYSQWIIT